MPPLYDWICSSCKKTEETTIAPFAESDVPPKEECPVCKEKTEWKRVIGPTSFILKGSGWYAKGGY
jgi:putative FmdB family regulatory protein